MDFKTIIGNYLSISTKPKLQYWLYLLLILLLNLGSTLGCNCVDKKCLLDGSCQYDFKCQKKFFGYFCKYSHINKDDRDSVSQLSDKDIKSCANVGDDFGTNYSRPKIYMIRLAAKDSNCSSNCAGDGSCDEQGMCNAGCKIGFFGRKCRLTCIDKCETDQTCHMAETCVKGCLNKYYGQDCSHLCSLNCAGNGSCDIQGNCNSGCKVGFYSWKCAVADCTEWTEWACPSDCTSKKPQRKRFCTGLCNPEGNTKLFIETKKWDCYEKSCIFVKAARSVKKYSVIVTVLFWALFRILAPYFMPMIGFHQDRIQSGTFASRLMRFVHVYGIGYNILAFFQSAAKFKKAKLSTIVYTIVMGILPYTIINLILWLVIN